jgi:Tfp pilus assembly protein PilF
MIRRAAAASFALSAALACAHSRPSRTPLQPDAAAMAEAGDSGEAQPHASARAYRHYLDALLARNADDLVTATAELREALLYDPESAHLHSVLAEVLLRQGRIGDAEEELQTALSLDSRHAPARVLSARIAAARGNAGEAREHLQGAIDGQPDEADAYRELARLFLAAGDGPAAEAVVERLAARLREAQKRSGDDPDALVISDRLRDQSAAAWVELGRWWSQHGGDDAARRAFAQARSASPSDPDALAAEGAWLETKRRFAEARERYVRLLAQRPEAPEVVAALARVALAEGEMDSACAHARKLLALTAQVGPRDGSDEHEEDRRDLAAALLRVAVGLLGAHRSADAQAALDGALQLYPNHPELSFYRAMAVVQRGHPREGALAFEAVERRVVSAAEAASPSFLGASPDAFALDARVQAALARGRAGETQEAMRRIRALFDAHPAEEEVALALLESFDRAGKAAEAEQLLSAAVRAHPEMDGLLYAWANAQDRAGMLPKALSTMRKVLATQPQHTGALNYIGYTLTERGDPADLREAEALLSRAVELRPDDGAIADSYGFCLLKLGRPADALVELRRADKLSPNDPVILSHLGDALIAAGRRDEARSVFRRALSQPASASTRAHALPEAQAMIDPRDRPDRADAKVRAEIEQKLKSFPP